MRVKRVHYLLLFLWACVCIYAMRNEFSRVGPEEVLPVPERVAPSSQVTPALVQAPAVIHVMRKQPKIEPSPPYWWMESGRDEVRNEDNWTQCIGSTNPLNQDPRFGLRICMRYVNGKSDVILYGGLPVGYGITEEGNVSIRYELKNGTDKIVSYPLVAAMDDKTVALVENQYDIQDMILSVYDSKDIYIQISLANGKVEKLYFVVPPKGHGILHKWKN